MQYIYGTFTDKQINEAVRYTYFFGVIHINTVAVINVFHKNQLQNFV